MDPTTQRLVHALLYAVLAGLGWTYSRAHREHGPIALVLAWDLVADVARLALGRVLDAHEPPYGGGVLVAYYLDHALVLSFRFALLAACWVVFEQRRPGPVGIAYAITLAALVVAKEATGASLIGPHAVIAALIAGVCLLLFLRVVVAPRDKLRAPGSADAAFAALLISAIAAAVLQHVPATTWPEIRYADYFVLGGLALGYAIALARGYARPATRGPRA